MTYETAVLMVQRHVRARCARRGEVDAPRRMSFRLARVAHDAGVKEHVSALKKHGYVLGGASRRMSFGIGPDGAVRIVPESAEEQAKRERRIKQGGSKRRGIDDFNAKLTRAAAHVVRFFGFDSSGVCVFFSLHCRTRASTVLARPRLPPLVVAQRLAHRSSALTLARSLPPPRIAPSYEGKNTRLHDFISTHRAMDAIQQLETFGSSECRDAVTVPNAKGETPLHLIVDQAHSNALGMLRLASKLLELGADPNAADFDLGETPLHRACRTKDAKGIVFVHLLLSGGADLAADDFCGWTPLHVACANGCTKIVVHLLREGARLDSVTRTPRRDHSDPLETPLHFAAMAGDIVAVEAIVHKMAQHGMDLGVKCSVSCLLYTVTFYANRAHSLTRSPNIFIRRLVQAECDGASQLGRLHTNGATLPGPGGAATAVWTATDCAVSYGAGSSGGDGGHRLVEATLRERGVVESASEQVRGAAVGSTRQAQATVRVHCADPPSPPLAPSTASAPPP